MIPFLDLKAINAQYRDELVEATTRVIDSGWYIGGNELATFEQEYKARNRCSKWLRCTYSHIASLERTWKVKRWR